MLLLAALLVVSGFFSFTVPQSNAQDLSGTRTFSSTASDAVTSYWSTNFTEAWDAYSAGFMDNAGSLIVGGMQVGVIKNILRDHVFFDTVDIPDSATITGATLSLYVTTDLSTSDYNVTLQGTTTYPHDPVIASDYYRGWYGSTNLGSRSTDDGLIENSFWNITLNAAGLAHISKTGTTRFCLRSSYDIAGIEPPAESYIVFSARDAGEALSAKLTVTYTVGSGNTYNYYFYGPYEDGGQVLNGTVHVRLSPNYDQTIEFDLTSDGVSADYAAYSLEQKAVLMTWNASATGNYSRVRYFTDDETETVYVTVPDPDLPFYLYAFTINDFVGVENGFLESTAYIDGATRVIERQLINTINGAPFYMTWSHVYGMRVQADQGTVDAGSFTALSDTAPTIIIPAGSFPQAFEGLAVTVNAARTNQTAIQVNYTDSDEASYWIEIWIKHRITSATYYTDYYVNTTANTYSLLWDRADDQTDYLVQVQSFRSDGFKDWSFNCPYRRVQTNLWSGLNVLGDGLPIEPQYIPGVVLVFSCALAFSFWHISAGAWISWVAAALCFMWNWLPYNETATPIVLGFAAFLCAAITIGEFKKGERTI